MFVFMNFNASGLGATYDYSLDRFVTEQLQSSIIYLARKLVLVYVSAHLIFMVFCEM